MNCLEFRRRVGAEPDAAAPEIEQHAAECEACARYRLQMQQMDKVIHRALSIDTQGKAPVAAKPSRWTQWSLAASVMLAVAFGVFWLGYPGDALARDVVEHVSHELGSLQPGAPPIDRDELVEVLAASKLRLKPGMEEVSYAAYCPFRGNRIPHLVVQTASGPVTVMLLTHEPALSEPRHFSEQGFDGVVVPAPRGVIVVLGKDQPLEEVTAKVLAAVDYEAAW